MKRRVIGIVMLLIIIIPIIIDAIIKDEWKYFLVAFGISMGIILITIWIAIAAFFITEGDEE